MLGNHDTICMVPAFEEMGIRMLLNEQERIERGGAAIHLAGVDDAHFYRMDNIEKAAHGIPHDAFSILLSHTPEIYRQAAHADFNVLLSGHTHGGQMCLPGGIPVTLNCVLPRAMGNGSFKHHDMIGYTSAGAGVCIVPARFNCPPEITLHHLHQAELIRPVAHVPFVEEPRQNKLADEEQESWSTAMSSRVTRQEQAAGKQRKQGLRDLVEADGLAAWREPQSPLDEARQEIAGHRHAAEESTNLPAKPEHARGRGGGERGKHDAADGLGWAEPGSAVGE